MPYHITPNHDVAQEATSHFDGLDEASQESRIPASAMPRSTVQTGLDPLTLAVAENLLRLRKQARLSQDALAQLAGVHKNTIYKLETRQQTMDLSTLYRIAEALKVDITALVRMSVGQTSGDALVALYLASPWAQIDKPSDREMESIRSAVASWLGAQADAEAVHHAIIAMRRQRT